MRVIPTVSLIVIASLGVGCRRSHDAGPPPPKVTVARPLVREIVEWDEYTGRLQALDSVEIRPRVNGYVDSIHFADGAIVKEGDLLFVIDPRPYEAVLKQAQAQVEVAQARLEVARTETARGERLFGSRAMSAEEAERRVSTLHAAGASVAAAQATVDAAALDVQFTRVIAPIAGRASRHLVDEGNLVTGGATNATLLTTIVSLDPIHCYFDVDERQALKYTRLAKTGERASSRDVNNPVEVALADETGFPHKGWMDFVDNQLDVGTGTIIARALLPNPDLLLSAGMFVRLRLPGSAQHQATLLPDEAIATDLNQKFVWVIDAENKAQYRRVTLGPLHEGLRIIREGVGPDDRVVIAGVQRVKLGIVVAPEDRAIEPPPAVAAGG
jgi:RND family efflux transporter MFP subunit